MKKSRYTEEQIVYTLKRLVADLSLDKHILQTCSQKWMVRPSLASPKVWLAAQSV